MKKHLKSIICIMMALCVSLGVFATGCGKEELSDPNADRLLRYRTYQGTHDYTSPDFESEDYLVKDGKSDYVLVTPIDADTYERTAKDEFLNLFLKATGVSLSTTTDDNLPEGTKFISIGETAQWEGLNVTDEELQKLTADGCRIVTKDKNIYIYGGDTGYWQRRQGVIYSVYTFMEIYFNFDYYYRNCISLDTGITELKLKDFNVWDIPDIDGRPTHGSDENQNLSYLRWYEAAAGLTIGDISNRLYRSRSEDAAVGMSSFTTFGDYSSSSAFMHNTSELVNPKSEGVDAKHWFSDAGDQLCYTAHGDEVAYNKLVEYICEKFAMSMKYFNVNDYPTRCYLGLMQEDNLAFCNCASCLAFNDANNGAVSAGMVRLCNDVITMIREWQEDPNNELNKPEYYRENLKIVFFVYNTSETPPAEWSEEQQKYVATSPECDPNEYVVGWLCPHWSYKNDIYNPTNDRKRQMMDAWGDLLDETFYWFYSANYQYDAYFVEATNILNSNAFQWMASMDSQHSFDNISAGGSDPTAFRQVELYLWHKLSWNSNLNALELKNKFFNAMYDCVADEMLEVHQMYVDHANLLALHNDWGGGYNRPKFWVYNGFLKPVADKFEAMLAKVDATYGETDPAYAELIKSRVCVEYIAPLYKILSLYGTSATKAPFTEAVRQQYKATLRNLASKYYPEVTLNNGEENVIAFVDGIA